MIPPAPPAPLPAPSKRMIDTIVALAGVPRPATSAEVAEFGGLGDSRGVAQTLRQTGRYELTEKTEDGYKLTRKGTALAKRCLATAAA